MNELIDEVLEKKDGKRIFIYGVGNYADRVYHLLLKYNIDISGFVVTNIEDACEREFYSLPVYKAKEMDFENVLLVIGVSQNIYFEIKQYLEEETNCNMDDTIAACEYLDHIHLENYQRRTIMEITTVIGCKVNCKYCPQKLLAGKYFENNPDRDRIMSMEVFRKCLKHLPDDSTIAFCGMAEPFLNKNCSDMILEARGAGKHIELYTTLEGAAREDIEKIWDLSFDHVNIHIPDQAGNAKISVTSEYLQLLSDVVKHRKADGTYFVTLCSSQGAPDEKIVPICQDKLDVLTALHDRAGNLDEPMLMHKEYRGGKLSCSGGGPELKRNVLLPDGTVLLCCMDYGMKHVIGNLAEQSYDEIIHGKEHGLIMQGLHGDERIDILCRKCSQSYKI